MAFQVVHETRNTRIAVWCGVVIGGDCGEVGAQAASGFRAFTVIENGPTSRSAHCWRGDDCRVATLVCLEHCARRRRRDRDIAG